jgi:hypothetical protein
VIAKLKLLLIANQNLLSIVVIEHVITVVKVDISHVIALNQVLIETKIFVTDVINQVISQEIVTKPMNDQKEKHQSVIIAIKLVI